MSQQLQFKYANDFLFLSSPSHLRCRLKGITGAEIWIDKQGDSEGNFSVLAFKESYFSPKDSNFTCKRHMIPVATFHGRKENNSLPVSEF